MSDYGKDSYVYGELLLRCQCGQEGSFEFHSIGWMFTIMDAREAGWRFDTTGRRSVCPKCGPKKFPEQYKNASQRNPKSELRRLPKKTGKRVEKEVRGPRRIRGS